MRTKCPAARRAAPLVALVVAITACGGDDGPDNAASTTATRAATGDSTTTTTVAPFGPLEDLPPVEIVATDLPDPPAGFIDEDVEALAAQAVSLATRGIDEAVWTASPEGAFDHVLSGLPPETVGGLEAVLVEEFGRVESWLLADSFDPQDLPIGPARVFGRHCWSSWNAPTTGCPSPPCTSACHWRTPWR